MNEKTIIRRLSLVGIFGNVILVAFKLYAGISGSSGAMVSDAVHSLSDVFATFVAFLGVRIAKKAPDAGHPYGHDRFECLASLALGLILLATAVGIGASGVRSLLDGRKAGFVMPGRIALVAAVVSILAKEAMFRYTMHGAKKLASSAFEADAWHHRSDALSSVGSLIGIAGARLGFPAADAIAALIICVFIVKVGADILRDAGSKLLDSSGGEEWESTVRTFVLEQPGIERVDLLRSRRFGSRFYLDLEVSVDGNLSLNEAHEIAERVHERLEKEHPEIRHVMIHENPAGDDPART